MDWVDKDDFRLHVFVLGWLYIFGNAFLVVLAALGFFLLPTIGVLSGDSEAVTLLSVVGTAFGALMLILAMPGIIAGYAILKRKPWARPIAMVIAVLDLVNFPFGTVIGIYALLVLGQRTATEYFTPANSA
jgi:hypothetical protein